MAEKYSEKVFKTRKLLDKTKGQMAELMGFSDRSQYYKHEDGKYDSNEKVVKEYLPVLQRLTDEHNSKFIQEGDEDELKKLRLHIQLLQSQMKKVFKKLGIEPDYEELKW